MNDLRCTECNKLILKYKLKGKLEVEFKCSRCNKLSVTKLTTNE